MRVIKAPMSPSYLELVEPSIFLAGSIEQGLAPDWQKDVAEKLSKYDGTIFNPRRDDYDSSWKQSITEPNFKQQVEWELDKLRWSKIIFMYLDPNTKSPISFMELGLRASYNVRGPTDQKLMVCCPDGFYRKGNIEIICDQYQIPLFNELNVMTKYVTQFLVES